MSLIIQIKPHSVIGINDSLQKLANSVNGIFGGNNTKQTISNTVCRGILQNDININFSNSYGATAYQGIYGALETASHTQIEAATFGASLQVVKAAADVANTTLNMGGVSLVGAGAASTRLYQGSTMSGFNTTMKWYTPKDKTYVDSLKALMILGFPSLRKPQTQASKVLNDSGKNTDRQDNLFGSFMNKVPLVGQIPSIITDVYDSLSSLASYNPPVLMVTIVDNLGNIIFQLLPLVISNITINCSRETYFDGKQRIPVVISATVSYEFYQIYGNNGYTDDAFIIGGVSLLGPMATQDG
jgi:hypothetical protein